jgi:hypothetical protein
MHNAIYTATAIKLHWQHNSSQRTGSQMPSDTAGAAVAVIAVVLKLDAIILAYTIIVSCCSGKQHKRTHHVCAVVILMPFPYYHKLSAALSWHYDIL